MYKISIDKNGSILDQYYAQGDNPVHLSVVDGVTWLESAEAKDIERDYWLDGAWAVKPPAPNVYYSWNGSEWLLDLELKRIIKLRAGLHLRVHRSGLLAKSDWTQLRDVPFSAEKLVEWETYRQALRDFPETNADNENFELLVWPTPPT
jgi:hypothetical protein